MKKYLILIFFGLLIITRSYCQVINHQEKVLIEQLLPRNELGDNALNFLKDWVGSTKFKIPRVVEILDHPLNFPAFLDEIDSVYSAGKEPQIIHWESEILFQADFPFVDHDLIFQDFSCNRVSKPRHIFDYIEFVFQTAAEYRNKAFISLEESDMLKLEYLLYSIHMEAEDSLKYDSFFKEKGICSFDSLGISDYTEIVEKIDFNLLQQGAAQLISGFEILQEQIFQLSFNNNKIMERETEWGKFCIGTRKSDIYEEEYTFILDPGGNDFYLGDIRTSFSQPFYLIIDLAGDDFYRNENPAGLFSVMAGAGIHYDRSGNDLYRGDDYLLSALLGYQFSLDEGGDDIYRGGIHSLAAATLGISKLVNKNGNDQYHVTEFGEGYAGTLGWGALLDYGGNDQYYAGGKYLHAPLAPFDYRSMAQGFGFGIRPDWGGGIGLLYDKEGNDRYQGGVYAQAVAYWYALGIIMDKAGNDFYDAVYYPQGSGIHLAAGFLYDEQGEDHYYSKHGPGQGAAHDYGVGFLVDRAGDDSYSVEGGNGLALTNSVAIFLDVCGNDRYERNNPNNYGYANLARDSGGIGIFLDTGGNDYYAGDACQNDGRWINGTFGLGFDTLMVESADFMTELAEETAAEVDSLADISEIFRIASEWGVGSAQKKVTRAGKILLQREEEAAAYIFEKQLGTKDGLTYRAIENFARESEIFRSYLTQGLNHEDSLWVKNTISLIGDLADSTFITTLQGLLEEGRYHTTILSALGRIKTDTSTEILSGYIESESEKIRIITARGLKNIGSEKAYEILKNRKNDDSFLIRTMVKLIENN
ncbi:MAG: HEAT repeat domain-containing protein [Candidatus Cloacimonetes bacterium]|nr:HEAT repeat domain-containing protein [Candidatus Cloacimonadota bacterium]